MSQASKGGCSDQASALVVQQKFRLRSSASAAAGVVCNQSPPPRLPRLARMNSLSSLSGAVINVQSAGAAPIPPPLGHPSAPTPPLSRRFVRTRRSSEGDVMASCQSDGALKSKKAADRPDPAEAIRAAWTGETQIVAERPVLLGRRRAPQFRKAVSLDLDVFKKVDSIPLKGWQRSLTSPLGTSERNCGLIRMIYEEARRIHQSRATCRARMAGDLKVVPKAVLGEACVDMLAAIRRVVNAYRAIQYMYAGATRRAQARASLKDKMPRIRAKVYALDCFASLFRYTRDPWGSVAEQQWKSLRDAVNTRDDRSSDRPKWRWGLTIGVITSNPSTRRSNPTTSNPNTRRSNPTTSNPNTRRSNPTTSNPGTRRSNPFAPGSVKTPTIEAHERDEVESQRLPSEGGARERLQQLLEASVRRHPEVPRLRLPLPALRV